MRFDNEINWHPLYSVMICEDPANISGDELIAKHLQVPCFMS